MGGDAYEGALELADVGGNTPGDETQDLIDRAGPDDDATGRDLLAQDGDTGLDIGRLDVGDQT